MPILILLALGWIALKLAELIPALLADAIATIVAAQYRWRSDRIVRHLAAAGMYRSVRGFDQRASRGHRRLLRKHLRLSIAMTAHCSLFPASSERGYALMGLLAPKTD